MSSTAFIPGRRVVQRGDRRFVCGPPTLGTVVRLSALFGQELDAALESYGTDEVATSAAFVQFTRAGGPAAAVLSTCCALEGGSPEDLEAAVSADATLAACLALAVLELADLRTIKGRFEEMSEPSGATPDPGTPDVWTFNACLLGEWFGCAPCDVFGWPFEAVLEALHATRFIREKRLGADTNGGAWRKSVSVAGLGVGVAEVRGRTVIPMRRRDG